MKNFPFIVYKRIKSWLLKEVPNKEAYVTGILQEYTTDLTLSIQSERKKWYISIYQRKVISENMQPIYSSAILW